MVINKNEKSLIKRTKIFYHSRCLPADDTLDRIYLFDLKRLDHLSSIACCLLSVLILPSPSCCASACLISSSRRSRTASSASSVAAATSSEATEAHSSSKQAHNLRKKGTAAPASPVRASSAHPSNVFSLRFYGQLTTFEKRLVQVLRLH